MAKQEFYDPWADSWFTRKRLPQHNKKLTKEQHRIRNGKYNGKPMPQLQREFRAKERDKSVIIKTTTDGKN